MAPKNIDQLRLFEKLAEKNSYSDICTKISEFDFLSPDEFGKAIKSKIGPRIKKSINVLALFSGAGGLDIGFCDAGFTLTESVEIEEKFVQTMIHNQLSNKYFPAANIICLDIKKYVPNQKNKIDFIIGGPPCQSFSAAGRRAAGVAGTKDDRGNLFKEYVRILNLVKPKGFLFENVYGLLGAEKGKSIEKIVSAFNKIGYTVSYRILDAADYGVPQHRERLIIVGSKSKEFKFPKPTHGPDSHQKIRHYSASKAIESVSEKESKSKNSINGRFGHLLNEVPPGLNYSFFTEKMGHPNPIFAWRSKFSDFLYKADPETPTRTLKASGGQYTGPFHWNNRNFTIAELKRLQTFPDNYEILGNRSIISKQIGNSVPPQFARLLALSVLDQFFNIELPFNLHYLEHQEKLSFRKLKSEKTKSYSSAAAKALDNFDKGAKKKIIDKIYKIDLSENFRLKINPDSKISVRFIQDKKKWKFSLSRDELKSKNELYKIEINRANHSPLFNDINEVHLISYSHEIFDYTILWKAFELVLSENHIKADLVQLSGYYQYKNDIVYKFVKNHGKLPGKIWEIIESILLDSSVGRIQNIDAIANKYDLASDKLIEYFYQLRKIGFEIRNNNTNSEILKNQFLIPYKFPTLTSLSVQLKKSLQTNV